MKKNKSGFLWLVVLAALAALVWFGRGHIHFRWDVLARQLKQASWTRIALGLACIYVGYLVRSMRWVLLVRHSRKLPLLSLLGAQVIGFTAVALIGRLADLVRPYLVARKTGLPLSSQIGVYVVERLFDAGSMALLASLVILLSPAGALPHPEIIRKAGYWGLALTLAGALFLAVVRFAGDTVTALLGRLFGFISRRAAQLVESKIQVFRSGLDTIRSLSDFALVAALSLGMWLLIALAYLETARAFVASPALAHMTLAESVLLMLVSGGASVIQLPVLGWFTQIGLVEESIRNFFGASPEASTGCAATLLLVTFLGIVPVGLIWARFDHVSLREVAEESEHAGEELAHSTDESPRQA